ncbi:MAG: Holliday junction resolvase RuvX [Agromyces sp.]
MRTGVRLGIDVGTARIGVARTDPAGMFASAFETVQRSSGDDSQDLDRILQIANQTEAIELVVGLPLSMSGSPSASTADAVQFAERLARQTAVPVRLVDERLSTVSATAQLHASGKKTRSHRPVIDQVAAVILLQHALDAERSGRLIGQLVERSTD